jgi:hypothetical protein
MESVDLRASLGRERQVKMRRLFAGLEDDQRSVVVRTAKLDTVRRLATPSGSSARRKNALLAAKSLTPNLTWSNMDCRSERAAMTQLQVHCALSTQPGSPLPSLSFHVLPSRQDARWPGEHWTEHPEQPPRLCALQKAPGV